MVNKIIQFVLAALIVSILGGFAGYYFFIKNKTQQAQQTVEGIGNDDATGFAGQVGSTYQNIASDTGTTSAEVGRRAPRLWQVTKTPVAGFGFGASGAYLFIAERATGNILRADPSTASIVRLTNTLLPKVHEALFSRSGDVVLRTTNDDGVITSFAATIATTTVSTSTSTPNVLEGTYLPQNIVAIDAPNNQPASNGLFFLTHVADGGSLGVSSTWKGASVKKLFTSPLYQWRAQALVDGRVILTQAAADDVPGYAFIVSASGTQKPLIVDVPGLSVRYHDTSDAYLYSSSQNGKIMLFVKVGGSKAVELPISTIAEKCVWAPGVGLIAYCAVPATAPTGQFLNKWYQGAVHTADVWWKIQANEGTAERFFVTDTRTHLDVEDPQIDEAGLNIGFRNAADKSLWVLRISE